MCDFTQITIIIIIIISAFLKRFFLGIQSAVAYIITPSGNHHNHFASSRTICNWPSARPISTKIVIFPTYDRYQMRSGQRGKLGLRILPRDHNMLVIAGLELTTLIEIRNIMWLSSG